MNHKKKELNVDVERLLDDEIPQHSEEFRELTQSMARLSGVSRKDIDGCEHASDVLKILHKRGHTEEGCDYERLIYILEKAQLIKVKRLVENLVRNYSPSQHVHAAAVTEPAPVVLHTCQLVRPVTVVKAIAVDLDKFVPACASREPGGKKRKQDSPNREDQGYLKKQMTEHGEVEGKAGNDEEIFQEIFKYKDKDGQGFIKACSIPNSQ